ncbi:hypothetical protein C6P40_000806 [Pichia californica]|uniref:Uncharacterized protein n=1 Tax=Pichia californica TaxID=460514 RepID=A0A9P6WPH9_9ASCO|nr:hypothetical protein C6P42_000476 [[Candida] californica]KAG0690909.1 hypothetical protein C6P40_000806 [[Candida] californica]
MAKLVVYDFNKLNEINESYFYRIIGSVLEYDYNVGMIRLNSLFDESTCDIQLNLDSEIGMVNQGSMFYEGLVVDVNVVNTKIKNKSVLYANLINQVNLPGSLIEYKDTLRKYSNI